MSAQAGPSKASAPLMTRTRSGTKTSGTKPQDASAASAPSSEGKAAPKAPAGVSKVKGKKKKRVHEPRIQEDVAYEYVPVAQMKEEGRKYL